MISVQVVLAATEIPYVVQGGSLYLDNLLLVLQIQYAIHSCSEVPDGTR